MTLSACYLRKGLLFILYLSSYSTLFIAEVLPVYAVHSSILHKEILDTYSCWGHFTEYCIVRHSIAMLMKITNDTSQLPI